MAARRWTLFICDECGLEGHEFRTDAACYPEEGEHHGRHGGPLEVMPVADHRQRLGEAARELDEEHQQVLERLAEELEKRATGDQIDRMAVFVEAASLIREAIQRGGNE